MKNYLPQRNRASENGNVFVYIFVAIALLAALTFAVSQSSRSTGKGLSEDRAQLAASEIISYGDTVAKAAGQLRLRGIHNYALRFTHPDANVGYGTYDTAPRAEIFNPQGGGVIYRAPPILAGNGPPLTYHFVGAFEVDKIGLTGCTPPANQPADCSELLLVVQGLRKEVCQMINDQIGLTAKTDDPPTDSVLPTSPFFVGNDTNSPAPYTYAGTIGSGVGSLLSQQTAGCYYDTGSTTYIYFQVLISR